MTHYLQKTEELLQQIAEGKAFEKEVAQLVSEIKAKMRSEPALGRELGPLVPKINKALKSQAELLHFDWVSVNDGHLAVGHKPGGKISFAGMKQAGVTAVLTLLQENEGAQPIGNALQGVDIEWLWFPFSAVRPEDKATTEAMFNRMKTLLEKGAKIYIHCSAGIHRTGMVTYAFLRYLGQPPVNAMEHLAGMRQLTADGATPSRLAWGDEFGT